MANQIYTSIEVSRFHEMISIRSSDHGWSSDAIHLTLYMGREMICFNDLAIG